MNKENIKEDVLKRFLDQDGKIIALPSKQQQRLEVLMYLAEKINYDKEYTEKEINQIISDWHTFNDYFILRRELVDNLLLFRTKNGSMYWKKK